MERMAAVDRNLLRAAVAELLAYPETPRAVVINEALEIARKFSSPESVHFVNGVLDSVGKELEVKAAVSSRSQFSVLSVSGVFSVLSCLPTTWPGTMCQPWFTAGARRSALREHAAPTVCNGELTRQLNFVICVYGLATTRFKVHGAWVGGEGAEGVQVVGQVGEWKLDLVAAAEAGADLVQQAIAARDQNCAGIGADIRADGSGVADEFNAAGHGAGAEIVDQDAGVAGGDDVELRAVGGGEEIDRLNCALAQFDALHQGSGIVANKVSGSEDRCPGSGRRDRGSEDVEPGRVQHEDMLSVGNRSMPKESLPSRCTPGNTFMKSGLPEARAGTRLALAI